MIHKLCQIVPAPQRINKHQAVNLVALWIFDGGCCGHFKDSIYSKTLRQQDIPPRITDLWEGGGTERELTLTQAGAKCNLCFQQTNKRINGKIPLSLPAWNGQKGFELAWSPWQLCEILRTLLLCLLDQCTCCQMGPSWLTCQKYSADSNKHVNKLRSRHNGKRCAKTTNSK